jgi:amidase
MRRLRASLVAITSAVSAVVGTHALSQQPPAAGAFSVVEASIADLRSAMERGRTTSREITAQYLARIERYNERLHAAIAVNPSALDEAEVRDRERRQKRLRGPLHGIPIALKDNIHTLDMPTTGGARAFAGLRTPYEATLTRRLLDAGAVIIAKTTLTELANWVSSSMPPGYNSLLGQSVNPYDPGRFLGNIDGGYFAMTPGGSSSGIGTAASLWTASVGSETSGSILNPANQNALVGIKPTVGRISRYGVIPITADQDTPGPLARSVADAAVLLGAMEGAQPDPHDPATRTCSAPRGRDYTRFLRRAGLKGARIGVPRASFYSIPASVTPATTSGRANEQARRPVPAGDARRQAMDEALATLRAAGAVVVDPADLPSIVATDPARNLLTSSICVGRDAPSSVNTCSTVLRYGMKRDFNAWLASLGSAAPVKTLTELREWNRSREREGTLRYGQDQLDASDGIDLDRDRARYEADRARDLALAGRDGIDAALRANKLDALVFPGFFGAPIAAKAGYPTVIVPFVPEDWGRSMQAPMGISFTGTACSEPRLIELAYAFEQATKRRVPPRME